MIALWQIVLIAVPTAVLTRALCQAQARQQRARIYTALHMSEAEQTLIEQAPGPSNSWGVLLGTYLGRLLR